MSFDSKDNKALLWNTLLELNMFDGIDNSNVNEIKNKFELTINNICEISIKYQQNGVVFKLVDLNKQFMSEFSQYLLKYKENNNLTEIYTAKERSDKRVYDLNNAIKKLQTERDISEPQPNDIDFSRPIDKEPITDMDIQLKKMIEDRNLINTKIDEVDKKKAATWINNSEDILKNENKQVSFSDNVTADNKDSSTISEQLSELINLIKAQTELIINLSNTNNK